MTKTFETQIAVIGTGMGGGMVTRALAEKGYQVLMLERGYRLPQEDDNWNPDAVFGQSKYKNGGTWSDSNGRNFVPGVHYYVGGNTKVYGASLIRFRERDFQEYEAAEGISPGWPFSYSDLEPYYREAEVALKVRGNVGEDPTEADRSSQYLYPAIEHEPYVENFATKLEAQGLHPFHLSLGVDRGYSGACILCKTCDGFPCKIAAKNDAETCGVDPALATGNARLAEGIVIDRLIHNSAGTRIEMASGRHGDEEVIIRAKTFIVSAGAANSAALFLRSKSDLYPFGIANSSGLVGKNWMVHNATFMVGMNPLRKNETIFQKTLAFNDWYWQSELGYPLGNVQLLGKLQRAMFKASKPWAPNFALDFLAARSLDLYLESEDLPSESNFLSVDSLGKIRIHWKPTNMKSHYGLVAETKRILRKIGYPIVLTERMGIETNSHQCGTLKAGNRPSESVLDSHCRTHDIENLFAVDGSFFPSSAALNPALTIAAQALRMANEADVLR